MIYLFVGLGLLVVLALFLIGLYNKLVKSRNVVDEAWSGIDVQLKRRYDLIPNLVETVKGYASHEKETLEKVVQLRNSAMNSSDPKEKGEYENQISGALKTIFALAEAYPDLKANQNFQTLQQDLSKIEDEIQNARRYYNATVRDFNNQVQTFPANLVASILGFSSREFFEADQQERENVKVDFSSEQK